MIKYVLIAVGFCFCLSCNHSIYSQKVLSKGDQLFETLESKITAQNRTREYNKNIDLIDSVLAARLSDVLACKHIAMLLHRKGQAFYSLSDWSKALQVFKDVALPVWENCDNYSKILKANTIYGAAMSAQYLNDFTVAIPFLNQSFKLYEDDDSYPRIKLAQKYRGAGFLYSQIGDVDLSEVFYLKAIQYFRDQENQDFDISRLLNDLGLLSQQSGKYEKAINYYSESIDYYTGEEIYAYHNLATIYLEHVVDLDKASFFANKVIDKAKNLNQIESQIDGYIIQGLIYHKKKNYVESRNYYQKALTLCDSIIQNNLHVRIRANIHEHFAESYLVTNDFINSNIHIDQAIQLMIPNQKILKPSDINIGDAIVRDKSELISMLALKADLLNHHVNSVGKNEMLLYHKIDSLFQLNLSNISLNNNQVLASSRIVNYYEQAIERNLDYYESIEDVDFYHNAYYFSSQLKALVLSNLLKKYKQLDKNDESQLRRLNSNLSEALLQYYNEEGDKDSISTEIIRHQREVTEFEQQADISSNSIFNSVTESHLNTIAQIQSELESDEAVLEYFEGVDNMYCFLIQKNSLNFHRIDLTDKHSKLIKSFIQSCQDPTMESLEVLKENSQKVHSLLVEPIVSSTIAKINKMIIIPDGILHALSFEALISDNNKYLITDHEIVYAYSHKLYFGEYPYQIGEKYIGFAPTYTTELNQKLADEKLLEENTKLAPLTLSVSEIEESASFYPTNQSYIEEQATKSNFVEIATQADILHLSMHALVDYRVPDNSSLIFSDADNEFIVKASEIASYDLNSDLVILSSCQSAAGLTTSGEGVQGLSRAFILAGTSSVLSSLWNSSELSSAELLPIFLKAHSKGKSLPNSLREAKLSFLSNARPSLQHPFYWANYILLSHDEVQAGSWNNTYLFIALSIICLVIFISIKKLN